MSEVLDGKVTIRRVTLVVKCTHIFDILIYPLGYITYSTRGRGASGDSIDMFGFNKKSVIVASKDHL